MRFSDRFQGFVLPGAVLLIAASFLNPGLGHAAEASQSPGAATPEVAPVREPSPEERKAAEEARRKAEEELKQSIADRNTEIKRLEAEAERYRNAIEEKGREANTLKARIGTLERTIKGISANIRVTTAKIGRTNLEITALGLGIRAKEDVIAAERNRIGELVRILGRSDRETALEILMKNESLADFFSAVGNIVTLQRGLLDLLGDLRRDRQELTDAKKAAEAKRLELAGYADNLQDQKTLQEDERRERNSLLTETKSQERQYQLMLADVERRRDALQQEINTLESGLTRTFDRSILPAPGTGILGWPVPEPIYITQHFGQTSFARTGAYSGKGHNGVDLRASVGTPVFAGEGGVVRATGDTDAGCQRASYGRWILLDHSDNLSTLYAHLSLVKVDAGQAVKRGELIAYAGKSGYATGPHLHFTVFARQAVEVGELKSRVCGRTMILPLSPFSGYLDPLIYL